MSMRRAKYNGESFTEVTIGTVCAGATYWVSPSTLPGITKLYPCGKDGEHVHVWTCNLVYFKGLRELEL